MLITFLEREKVGVPSVEDLLKITSDLLLRDCTTSPINRFAALPSTQLRGAVPPPNTNTATVMLLILTETQIFIQNRF